MSHCAANLLTFLFVDIFCFLTFLFFNIFVSFLFYKGGSPPGSPSPQLMSMFKKESKDNSNNSSNSNNQARPFEIISRLDGPGTSSEEESDDGFEILSGQSALDTITDTNQIHHNVQLPTGKF